MSIKAKLKNEHTSSTIHISGSNLTVNKRNGSEVYDLSLAESIEIETNTKQQAFYAIAVVVGFVIGIGTWMFFPSSAPNFVVTYIQPGLFGVATTVLLYGIYQLVRLRDGIRVTIRFPSGNTLQLKTDKENQSIFEQSFYRSNDQNGASKPSTRQETTTEETDNSNTNTN